MCPQTELKYFISEKGPYLVASLEGVMTKMTLETLEACGREILSKPAESVIVSFHGVSEIQLPAINALVKLQASIRQKPAELKLCFLSPKIFELLSGKGAIRSDEVFQTLRDALATVKRP